ncbi:MAG: response regulator transcription factor [Thermomicrobiales bacterium]
MAPAVLIVEDDRDIAAVFTELLISEGYDVVAVYDGQQALEVIFSHAIDLVVSDIRMPRLNGLSLIHEVRASGSAVPFILISTIDTEYRTRDLTNVEFLRKPVEINELIGAVKTML